MSAGVDPIENAKSFLACARQCEKLAPNVAYVLATTALEEVGKAIFRKQKLLEQYTNVPAPPWAAKHAEDHQKKLFWAIWTPMLGNQIITGKEMEEAKQLSISIHSKRIKSQYSDEGNAPREAVSSEEVHQLIEFTEARIRLEEGYKPVEPDPDRTEKMNWFLNLRETREDAKLIFSGSSMKKLSELGDAYQWVCWLKEQFDQADAESKKLVEAELNREIDKSAEKKIKWKMTVRLVSKSHSIRQNELVKWNEGIDLIKIKVGDGKKEELIVDFLFSDQFHIKSLWWQSHAMVNHFLVGLNIGTFGYFWWQMPPLTERFYEKLEDLESKSDLRLENHPNKPIQWGNLVLTKEDLNRVAICMTFVGRCKETKIFDHYLTGLGFLAKSDVIMRFELNALEAFVRCLQLTLERFQSVDLKQFLSSPTDSIGDLCKDWEEKGKSRIKELVSWVFSDKRESINVDPDDVGKVKILADYILQGLARKTAEASILNKRKSY